MLPTPEAATTAFAEVSSFVKYWLGEVGPSALELLLLDLRATGADTPDPALESVSGYSLSEWNTLWRANLRRLDFEAIRDSMLVFGGKLDPTLGGKPVHNTLAYHWARLIEALYAAERVLELAGAAVAGGIVARKTSTTHACSQCGHPIAAPSRAAYCSPVCRRYAMLERQETSRKSEALEAFGKNQIQSLLERWPLLIDECCRLQAIIDGAEHLQLSAVVEENEELRDTVQQLTNQLGELTMGQKK